MDETNPADLPGSPTELRDRFAAVAERMALAAEVFASILENSSRRSDYDRRVRTAQREKQIAAVLRRRGEILRESESSPVVMPPLPSLTDESAGAPDEPPEGS